MIDLTVLSYLHWAAPECAKAFTRAAVVAGCDNDPAAVNEQLKLAAESCGADYGWFRAAIARATA